MSKTLATIDTHADIAFDLEDAKHGNPYTKEAHEYFQRLQFKNLLGRFDVETAANKVESYFKEITDKKEAEQILEEAGQAEVLGAALTEDNGNVLPLFAHPSGYGRLTLCYGREKIYSIVCSQELEMEYLFTRLSELAGKVKTFAMFDLKKYLPAIHIPKQEACFDVTVAAYLLNPLKSDYDYEDVAREQLTLMIDEKAEPMTRACYEAYTAFAAVPPLTGKMQEEGMYHLFTDIEMPLVFTLFDMECAGIQVEAQALKFYGEQLGGRIVELEKEIYEMAGETFNINSPKQLGVVLFDHMQLPNGKKTKTG